MSNRDSLGVGPEWLQRIAPPFKDKNWDVNH